MTPAPARPDAPLDDSECTLTIDDVSERYARAGPPVLFVAFKSIVLAAIFNAEKWKLHSAKNI